MYAEIIFLYYFDDFKGSVLTGLSFCIGTLIGSIIATHFPDIWYGIGLTVGSLSVLQSRIAGSSGWKKNLDIHIFCNGHLLQKSKRKLSFTEGI